MTEKTPDEKIFGELIPAVCAWYRQNRRELPWRENTDPYRIWVSEIMLQQTRVEAVIPYYERFLAALPDVRALAVCPEDRLLKLWEGLGYYSRVRSLQQAAIQICEQYGGNLPEDPKTLEKLKGIGAYTAGAVASIAFGVPVPAVDGNVLRVISRVTADERSVDEMSVRKEVRECLQKAMEEFFTGNSGPDQAGLQFSVQDQGVEDASRQRKSARYVPGDFNQGLMDLGASVCVSNGMPKCGVCPLADKCAAFSKGMQQALPVRGKKAARRILEKTVLLIQDGERIALTKRPDRGLLAGMYEFPCLEGYADREAVLREIEKRGLTPLYIEKLPDAKHVFTHLEWHMTGYAVRVAGFPETDIRAGTFEKADGQPETVMETEQPEKPSGKTGGSESGSWILTAPDRIEQQYPVPSAYAAYAGHAKLRLRAAALGITHHKGSLNE